MQKQIKNLILFLILALNLNAAFCYTLTSNELKSDILSKVTPEIKSQISKYSSDFKINITGIAQNSIVTNENVKPKIEVVSQNNNFSQNSYKRILIKDSKGVLIKAFPVNVQTLVYAPVLVANEIIPYNQSINSSNTKIEKREISKYLGNTFAACNSNMVSARNYPKDSVILLQYTKQKAAILKNSSIDIVFESKGLNIKLRGQALKDGAIGDRILVKSDKYNKTYNGIIKSENEVIVRI